MRIENSPSLVVEPFKMFKTGILFKRINLRPVFLHCFYKLVAVQKDRLNNSITRNGLDVFLTRDKMSTAPVLEADMKGK